MEEKMKKILSLLLVMMILSTSMFVFADTETVKPILISAHEPTEFTPTGIIKSIESDSIDLLVGDIVKSFTVNNSEDFVINQRVQLIKANEENVFSLKPFINTSNVKHNSIGTLIEKNVYINDKPLDLDVLPHSVDGVMMVPLAETLRALGYEVTWDNDTHSVDILKGAQWTSITIGKNAYFKNRMAPRELSHAPIIIDGRTLVPVEFFNEILNLGMGIKNGDLYLNEESLGKQVGYIQEVNYKANDQISITISSKKESTDIMDQTIIHASVDTTYFNNSLEVGTHIEVITLPIMTMSIPGQTSALVIY
jgi:hypothetical protein